MKHMHVLFASTLLGISSFSGLAASTDTWVGGSGNNFSTTGNWTYSSGSGPVASGDSLVFSGAGSATPNNDTTGFTYGGITFNGTTLYAVGGNPFTLASGGSIVNNASVTQTVNNNIALSGTGGILNPSVASASCALTLGGIISGSANLTKSGGSGSTLTLTGANTFSGVLTFNSGLVIFTTPPSASGGNLGNPSGITFGGSSTTTLQPTSGAGSVTISGPTITANASSTAMFKNGAAAGTVYEISAKVTGAGNCKQNTPITTGAIVRFSNDGNDYTGICSMAGGFVEYTSVANGGSPAALGGKGSGTYAVINQTSAATLRYVGAGISSTTRLLDWQGTTGSFTLDSGPTASGPVVSFLGTGNLRSGSGNAGFTLTGSSTGANTLAQVINDGASSGTTSLTKSGTGTWVLSGANGYSAGTTISAGTLQLSGSGTLGSSAGSSSLTGSTLDLGGTSQTQGAVTLSGASTLTNGTLTASSFSATPTAGNTVSISANLAGAPAALSHTGAGTVALLGTNTYNGGTTIGGGGILVYNNLAPAGSACALGLGSLVDLKSGALQYLGPTATNSRAIQLSTFSGNPVWNVDNAGTNTTLTFTADILGGTNGGAAGARTLGLNVNCAIDAGSAGTLKMLGAIPDATPTNSTTVVVGGASGYSVFNGGTVGLLNPTNTFSGAVQVKYARTLQVMSLADSNTPCSIGLGTNPPSGTAPIIIGSTDSMRGGVLAYVGTNDASCNRQLCVEGVNFGGQSAATLVNNSPNNSSLHLSCPLPVIYYSGVLISNCSFTLGGSANATNTFDMAIANTPLGNAGLTVSGSTWLLTAAHSYAGNTIVSGGTLLVNGSIGGTALTNTAGTLGGSGIINCPVTIQAGGNLQPGQGNGSLNTLTINNAVKLSGRTTLFVDRSGSASSLLTGVSTLTYGGTLNVTNVGAPLVQGDTFTLFSATTYAGGFTSSNLPPLAAGLQWDTAQLAPGANGTITVVCDGTLAASAGSVAPICAGASVQLGGSPSASGGGSSGYTYAWTPALGLDDPAIANPTATPAATTQYTLLVTDANGCTASSQVTVTVNPLPSTSAIVGPGSVCASQAGAVYSVDATVDSSYAWTVPSGATVTAGAGSSSITVTFGSDGGTVSVVETSGGGCAGSPVSLPVSVSPASIGGVAAPDASHVCAGTGTAINLSGQTGTIVRWESSPDSFAATTNEIVSTANPLSTGNLAAATAYRAVVQSGVCSSAFSSVAQVTVDASSANGSFTASPNPALPGALVTFTATVTNTSAGCPAPTGSVLFTTNGVPLGDPVVLDVNGVATFTTNSLPHGSNAVTAEYAGDANIGGLTNSLVQVVNSSPTVGDTNAGVTQNQTLAIGNAELLALGNDPDGDALSLASAGPTSTNGGTITLTGGNVNYTPVTDFVGTDAFSFVLSDTYGASATGMVVVTVSALNPPPPNIVVPPAYDSASGTFTVTFAGIPNLTYSVQWAAAPTGPWDFLATATAGTNGLFEVSDTELPPPPARYYRTTYP
jgi:fibronectin-binding autotransporter adhesin